MELLIKKNVYGPQPENSQNISVGLKIGSIGYIKDIINISRQTAISSKYYRIFAVLPVCEKPGQTRIPAIYAVRAANPTIIFSTNKQAISNNYPEVVG